MGEGGGGAVDEGKLASADALDYVRDEMLLRAEYQTLSRLPRNPSHILFMVKTYIDPMRGLERAPAAAQALAATMRRKYKGMNVYQGIGRDASQQAILAFLDRVAASAGLPQGPILPRTLARCVALRTTAVTVDHVVCRGACTCDTHIYMTARVALVCTEPWERDSMVDGTSAADTEREMRRAHAAQTPRAAL